MMLVLFSDMLLLLLFVEILIQIELLDRKALPNIDTKVDSIFNSPGHIFPHGPEQWLTIKK